MTHPSSLDLEAFACGERVLVVDTHLGECTACQAFVERVRGALSAGPSRSRAAEAIARAAARESKDSGDGAEERPATVVAPRAQGAARPRWWVTASTAAVPLAVAAALLLLLRTPSTRDALVPPSTPPSAVSAPDLGSPSNEAPVAATEPDPETTFKGGVHIAVIRERAGHQGRFTGTVAVKPGDRLRVEVALDREQAILAAVMGDDLSWLELMTEGTRRPGTHFSERSARVDTSPMRGTIIVGSPEAVSRARSTKRFDDVAMIRVEWESP